MPNLQFPLHEIYNEQEEGNTNSGASWYQEVHGLSWLDYVIFALTLLIALGIGVYHSLADGGQKTTSQYLMANRQLKPFPVALSIFMSVISGILVLGTSAEMYIYGTQLWMEPIARGIMYVISAKLYVPLMHGLKITSVFEYHLRRFNSDALHLICVILNIVLGLSYMGMAMYAPSTALEAVTGFPVWASLVCTGVVAVVYTTIGGMKAVVWTDFFQGFVLFGGLIIILIVGSIRVGGVGKVWEISKDAGRINFFDMNPDPTERMTFWTVMFGAGLYALSQSANEQSQVQRYCALPTVREATFVVLLQIPLLIAVYSLTCFCGLIAFAYYDMIECDPYRSKQVSNTNQLLPYFVVDVIAVNGLTGLFVAVLFSGALSSVSSTMNSLAAVTWKDILEKHFKGLDETRKTILTKFTALVYGIIGVMIGFTMKFFRGNVMQLATSLLAGLGAPLAGVVLAGTLIPWVQGTGMIIGVSAGLMMFLWINIGQFITYPHRSYLNTTVENCSFGENETALEIPEDPEDIFWLYRLSFQYIPLASMGTTILVGLIASLITGKQDPKKLDPSLMVNLGDRCGCCCTASCKDTCTCGVPYDSSDTEEYDEDKNEKHQMNHTDDKHDQNKDTIKTSDETFKNGQVNKGYTHEQSVSTQL